MPEERVTVENCRNFRKELYSMIFPRWALIIAGALIVSAVAWVYGIAATATDRAVASANQAKLLEQKLTMTVEHIKENQLEMKVEQKEQRMLLQKIDRRLNSGR